jgi:alanine dehydrogenase
LHPETSTLSNSPRTLVLDDRTISKAITLEQVARLVEAGFAANALGCAVALPVVIQSLANFDVHFGIKSGYVKSCASRPAHSAQIEYLSNAVGNVLGLKAGGYWLKNSAAGLPAHRATLLLLDPGTGAVVAVMSANSITRLRTAAAGAIGAKYLSRVNSETVGILGAGEQAHAQLEALRLYRQISQVYVWARRLAAAEAYAEVWGDSGLRVEPVQDVRAATERADIVITTTPSREALMGSDFVRPGTHITAVGSDGQGKQELDVSLLRRAKVVVDNTDQSLEIGELQHAVRAGVGGREMIHAELGEICAQLKPGRENDEEITVFDSSGVSFQDLVVAGYLVRQAQSEGFGEHISL